MKVIEKEPRIKFQIKINTEEFLETDDGLTCDLLFIFPAKYPDEAPIVEIEEDNVSIPIKNEVIDKISCLFLV